MLDYLLDRSPPDISETPPLWSRFVDSFYVFCLKCFPDEMRYLGKYFKGQHVSPNLILRFLDPLRPYWKSFMANVYRLYDNAESIQRRIRLFRAVSYISPLAGTLLHLIFLELNNLAEQFTDSVSKNLDTVFATHFVIDTSCNLQGSLLDIWGLLKNYRYFTKFTTRGATLFHRDEILFSITRREFDVAYS